MSSLFSSFIDIKNCRLKELIYINKKKIKIGERMLAKEK